MFTKLSIVMTAVLVLAGALVLGLDPRLACADSSDVVITEVLYNADSVNTGSEFIEFHNRGATDVNIGGWVVTDAVDYSFPSGTTLGVGQYLVIARDQGAASSFYGVSIFGEYVGRLDNDTESIVLRDNNLPRHLIDVVPYADSTPWPLEADGVGPSLELFDVFADNSDGDNWGVGDLYSPGAANAPISPGVIAAVNDIVISEIMYRPRRQEERREFDSNTVVAGPYMEEGDDELGEYVEIYNRSSFSVDLSGWKFSDGFFYAFPDGTMVNSGQYFVIGADDDAMRRRFGLGQPFGPFDSGSLSDGGERITLRDDTDTIVDTLVYDDRPPWSVAADEFGVSLEVIDVDVDNSTAANWRVSTAEFPPLQPSADGNADWQLRSFRGIAPTSSLYFQIDGAGEWLIDDIRIFEGEGPTSSGTAAHYRFEESSGTDITNDLTGIVEGTLVGAGRSGDSPGSMATSAQNLRSADFTSGRGVITGRDFPLHDVSGDRTVEWFMKVPFAQEHGGVIWSNADDSSDANRFNIFWGARFVDIANTVSGDFRGPGGVGPFAIAAHENASSFPIGQWTHVAIVRTELGGGGFDWQWFVNGVQNAQGMQTSSSDALPTARSWLLAGRQGSDGIRLLMDEIRLSDVALKPAFFLNSDSVPAEAELIYEESFESGASAWNALGNHGFSATTTSDAFDGVASYRLVASGPGSSGSDAIVSLDFMEITPGQSYTITFNARYVDGTPSLTAGIQGGSTVTLIPPNLQVPGPPVGGAVGRGTPGRVNSVASTGLPPFVEDVHHLIETPTSGQAQWVLATVRSERPIALVEARYSIGNSTSTTTIELLDLGGQLDGEAGDGVYGGAIAARPSQTLVHYSIRAVDDLGRETIYPYAGEPSPTRAYYHYNGELFTQLTFYDLYLTDANLNQLVADPWGREYVDCSLVIDGVPYPHMGVRLRGRFTSREHPKRQWKFRFNKPDKHLGYRTLDTQLQIPFTQKMVYEVYDHSGIMNLRSDLVRVHRNGSFHGVYVAFEAPNSSWLTARGLDSRGEVFKARTVETPGRAQNTDMFENQLVTDLDYWGAWNKKMNSLEPPDVIRDLVVSLNQLSGDDRRAWMDRNIDLDQWFTRWALYVLMNVDDFTSHNYYAFHRGEPGGRWQSLAYDFDSGFTYNRVGAMRALYGDGKNGDNWLWQRGRIYDIVSNDATLRRIYYFKIQEMLTDFYHSSTFFPIFDAMFAAAAPERALDISRWGTMRSSTTEIKNVFNAQRSSMLNFIGGQNLPSVKVSINPIAGEYSDEINVGFSAPAGWTVAYTSDGSDPRLSDTRSFTFDGGGLTLTASSVVRAAAYRGSLASGDWTRTSESAYSITFEPTGPFLRGDCNSDGAVDAIEDGLFLLFYSFAQGTFPQCVAACDANGDGSVLGEGADAVWLLSYGFLGGPPPVAPFPACGITVEADDAVSGCAVSQPSCQ